jgi:hypothetical protein
MDQNQTVDNDLQKAIDNITNTTNVDPVFSDPVAAPSSVPEGDTGELGEPVGPFPEAKVEMVQPAPEPIAPLDPINIPDLSMPAEVPTQTPETPAAPTETPAPVTPETSTPEPVLPEAPAPGIPAVPEPMHTLEPVSEPAPNVPANLNTHQIKEAALRDLIPLLGRLDMAPAQKFDICRHIFEDLKDYTVLEQAYHAASEIPDETERAEALLYLVESIDKM